MTRPVFEGDEEIITPGGARVRWNADGTYTPRCALCVYTGKSQGVHSTAAHIARTHASGKGHLLRLRRASVKAIEDEIAAEAQTPPEVNPMDRPPAAHELIEEAERIARDLRVVSDGKLTLAVHEVGSRAALPWDSAHELVEHWSHMPEVAERRRPR